MLASTSLGERGTQGVTGEDIGITVRTHGIWVRGIDRIKPRSGRKLHHTFTKTFIENGTGEERTSIIEYPDYVSGGDVTVCGIRRMQS